MPAASAAEAAPCDGEADLLFMEVMEGASGRDRLLCDPSPSPREPAAGVEGAVEQPTPSRAERMLHPLDALAWVLKTDSSPANVAEHIWASTARVRRSDPDAPRFLAAAQMVADDTSEDASDRLLMLRCVCQAILQLFSGAACCSFMDTLHGASSAYILMVLMETLLVKVCENERLRKGPYGRAFLDLLHEPGRDGAVQLACGSGLYRGRLKAPFSSWEPPLIEYSSRRYGTLFNARARYRRHEPDPIDLQHAAAAFACATGGRLDVLLKDWGMVAAGGMVLHALKGTPAGDVDLFFVGLTKDQAQKRIRQAIDLLQPTAVVVTRGVVTLEGVALGELHGYDTPPRMDVQIMQRLYTCKQQVVASFDLAPCRVLFDGQRFLALPTAVMAMTHNVCFPDFRFATTPMRSFKYHLKGFDYLVPVYEGLARIIGDLMLITMHDSKQQIGAELLRMVKMYNLASVFALARAFAVHLVCEDLGDLSSKLVLSTSSMEPSEEGRPTSAPRRLFRSSWAELQQGTNDSRLNVILDRNWSSTPCERLYATHSEAFLMGLRATGACE